MNISVNTRLLMPGRLEGIGWFTFEIFRRLAARHPEHRFHYLFDRPFADEFLTSDNIVPHVLPVQARHPVLWHIWHEWLLPRHLNKTKPDIFIATDGLFTRRGACKAVSVIHDLNFEHHPEVLPPLVARYYRRNIPDYARRSTRLAAVSAFTKEDVKQTYGFADEQIDVVYNGVRSEFAPMDEVKQTEVRQRVSGGAPYFVYVGSIHPRKNIARLLQAYDRFREAAPSNIKLVLAGARMWNDPDIEAAYNTMKFRDDVILTGRISSAELCDILAAALALTYVSLFEGFGIPIVEAFASDVPVLTSDCTSMPEVAGDAAVLVNPESVDAIAQGMRRLASSAELREQLIAAGRARAQHFSWEHSADSMWRCIEHALG